MVDSPVRGGVAVLSEERERSAAKRADAMVVREEQSWATCGPFIFVNVPIVSANRERAQRMLVGAGTGQNRTSCDQYGVPWRA